MRLQTIPARRSRPLRDRTPTGHLYWTKQEDQIVRAGYPDYLKLRRQLQRRTYAAILARVRYLGIADPAHRWLPEEVSRLRRLYPKATSEKLLTAFPGMTIGQIRSKASRLKVRRARTILADTRDPLLNAIRARAFALRITMTDLDEIAGTRRYFQDAYWLKYLNHQALAQAVRALEGEINVRWNYPS